MDRDIRKKNYSGRDGSRGYGSRKDGFKRADSRDGSFKRADSRDGSFKRADSRDGSFKKAGSRSTGFEKADTWKAGSGSTGFNNNSFRDDDFKNEYRADRDSSGTETESPIQGTLIEGRNAVLEALRSDRSIDRVFILDGNHDNALGSIISELKKHPETKLDFVSRQRLDGLSETGKHQGVIAFAAAYDYAELDDILENAKSRGEQPFIFVLDGIEDPHNLGAIIRTANLAGAHGVIIRLNRAVGLTATVAKASAGALNYTPVVKVNNIARTIEELKEQGLWFVCADMDGENMYSLNLDGPIGLVIGNEGKGVSDLVKKKCDMVASIPQFGEIDSLNASVAAGVLAYEVVRRRTLGK